MMSFMSYFAFLATSPSTETDYGKVLKFLALRAGWSLSSPSQISN
jgi:hypothetical protein